MADRKDYPKEKLDAMVDAFEYARARADRGSRDTYVRSEFMFAAVEAGERWDLENSPEDAVRDSYRELEQLKVSLAKAEVALTKDKIRLNDAVKAGEFGRVAALATAIASQEPVIEAMKIRLDGWTVGQ